MKKPSLKTKLRLCYLEIALGLTYFVYFLVFMKTVGSAVSLETNLTFTVIIGFMIAFSLIDGLKNIPKYKNLINKLEMKKHG